MVERLISMQYKAEGTAITVSTKEKVTKNTFSRKLAILMDLTFYDSCNFYVSLGLKEDNSLRDFKTYCKKVHNLT